MVLTKLSGALCIAGLCLSCASTMGFTPRRPDVGTFPYEQVSSIPFIFVGRIVSNVEVGHQKPAPWNKYQKVQLYRVNLTVENVLQGRVDSGDLYVYYFAYWGPIGSPPGLGMSKRAGDWHIGDREMFFLRKESGKFRTICDISDRCVVPVFSGPHPQFRINTTKPLEYNIIDLLLTRGNNADDEDMIKAIHSDRPSLFSQSYTIVKLKQLVREEAPKVRDAACKALLNWGQRCSSVSAR